MTLKFNEEFAINPQSVESGGGGGGGEKLKYTVVIDEKGFLDKLAKKSLKCNL